MNAKCAKRFSVNSRSFAVNKNIFGNDTMTIVEVRARIHSTRWAFKYVTPLIAVSGRSVEPSQTMPFVN
jgi:hypothetical protein